MDPTETIIDSDTQAVIERAMTGKRLDPEVYRRIRERGDRLTEEISRSHGVVNIAVDLIRRHRRGG